MKKASRRIAITGFALLSGLFALGAHGGEEEAAGPTIYERLGGMEGITQIVADTIERHHNNPKIGHYFDGVDDAQLQRHVVAFFAAGTGGPTNYQGRDMTTTHASMNMSNADFDSAVADVSAACAANGVDDETIADVVAILESLRPAVMGTATS